MKHGHTPLTRYFIVNVIGLPVVVHEEHVLSVVTALRDTVRCTRYHYSRYTCHDLTLTPTRTRVNKNRCLSPILVLSLSALVSISASP